MSKLSETTIQPALTPDEWGRRRRGPISVHHLSNGHTLVLAHGQDTTIRTVADLCALMALANDALPDGEPRKITRDWLVRVQTMSDMIAHLAQHASASAFLRREAAIWFEMARALEALLPPSENSRAD